jgi:drug/metabolite transporter (DMT)-like permease
VNVRAADVVRLIALAMIWGASFVFFRVLALPVGPVGTVTFRVLVAGVVLVAWLAWTAREADVRGNWRAYLFMGVVNSAIPFLLFAYAAYTLPAAVMSILNAATPLFTTLLAARFLGEALDRRKLAGIAMGVAGVALVTGGGAIEPTMRGMLAVGACLAATFCYAVTGVWLKRKGSRLTPYAGWSQLFAGLVLLPFVPLALPPGPITPLVVANLLGLALLCSAVAFLLYYRLMRDIGPTRTMTVTFLIPAFGIAWGALLLGERIAPAAIGGVLLIVSGTAAVLMRRPAPAG